MSQTLARLSILLTVLFIVGLTCTAALADLRGTDALLDRLERSAAGDATRERSEAEQLRDDLEQYSHRVANLPVEEQASTWSDLLLRAVRLKPLSLADQQRTLDKATWQPISAITVLRELPPPETWPQLAATLDDAARKGGFDAQQKLGLRLLAASLGTDFKITLAVVRESIAHLDGGAGNERYLARQLHEVEANILARDGQPQNILAALRLRRAGLEEWSPELELPDLVSLVGEQHAREFISESLRFPRVELSVPAGGRTLQLAQQIALENIDSLRAPQWRLTQHLNAIPLYEALERRFGAVAAASTDNALAGDALGLLGMSDLSMGAFQRERAGYYYLLSLIAAGRQADAVSVAQSLGLTEVTEFPKQALYQLQQGGFASEVHAFLGATLAEHPGMKLWRPYIDIANLLGKGDQAVDVLSATLATPGLNERDITSLRVAYADALFANDRVADGILELQQVAPALKPDDTLDAYLRIASIGLLLKDPATFAGGVASARKFIDSGELAGEGRLANQAQRLAGMLLESGDADGAEALLFDRITKAASEMEADWQMALMAGNYQRPLLAELAHVYFTRQRHEDVLMLIDDYPAWSTTDLHPLIGETDSRNFLLGYYAAWALAESGQRAAAVEIAQAVVRQHPGFDPAYELLVELEGENSLEFFEAIYLTDQFEERPLIWSAIVLSLSGKYERAKAFVQQAISIDPSDGEQGRNHRLRAYATLADILDAQGDSAGAQTYREAVQAIRISEYGDRLREAGLTSAGIRIYEEAAELFSGAYCIQSRLAIQQSRMGRHEQAAEHYRKAYELMPDSFGRVESHCLGCESVFDAPAAANLAEQVFTDMLAAREDNPRVHYMLGYLYFEQERFAESLEQFRAAVSLDPQYLNGWKKLDALAKKTVMPGWERELATVRMLELDPLQRHVHVYPQDQLDLAPLYRAQLHARMLQASLDPDGPLYPLEASQLKLQQDLSVLSDTDRELIQARLDGADAQRRSDGLLNTSIVAAAASLLGAREMVF